MSDAGEQGGTSVEGVDSLRATARRAILARTHPLVAVAVVAQAQRGVHELALARAVLTTRRGAQPLLQRRRRAHAAQRDPSFLRKRRHGARVLLQGMRGRAPMAPPASARQQPGRNPRQPLACIWSASNGFRGGLLPSSMT
jgi:hypothetical protein